MSDNKRYAAIDGLRTFACIGIIAMHVLTNGKYDLGGFVFDKLIISFTNLVFLFMTISAFGMCCGYYEKFIEKKIDIVAFYKKRYLKLLPFFALLCFLDLAISPSLDAVKEVFANLTLCFGLIPNADISVIGVGWFLGTIFVFYLMFPFFCFLLADKKRAWFAFAVSVVMHYISADYFGANRKSIVFCFAFFMAGGLIFLYKEHLKGTAVKLISLVVFILSCVTYFLFSGSTIVMIIIGSSLLIFAVTLTGKGILVNRFTGFIGKISFEIYLCHMVVYRVLEKVRLLKVTGSDLINYIAAFIMVAVGAAVFAFIAKTVIDKVIDVIGKRICNRSKEGVNQNG